MADGRPRCVVRSARRWAFGDALFDEGEWQLSVAGRPVAIETKPLELLRALLEQAGHVVAKDALLDRIWPDVTVVEASLTTAASKLRRALGEEGRSPIITVPGIGYRFEGEVRLIGEGGEADTVPPPPPVEYPAPPRSPDRRRALGVATALAGLLALVAIYLHWPVGQVTATTRTAVQREQLSAMRRLDLAAADRLIAAGWDVNAPYDQHGTNALEWLINMCEWDPGHDRRKMLLLTRTLVDSGLDLHHRNSFGDTAYSIARATRYCGPDHPVTVLLRRACTSYEPGWSDRCMASYELARGQHFPG